MKDIRLYIANKLVDCSDKLSLPVNYIQEDFNNPTIVKNSFSKTISIPGTKNNNALFGEIYKLDRMQHYEEWTGNPELNGINFDPSKRVDFQIFKDGELIEDGYMQLNDILIDEGNKISYNITLYGGVGDFFYGLKYKEDGTTKTLADLRYFVEDNNGDVLPEETEMDFVVNKDFVADCFSHSPVIDDNKIKDFVTFIPAYNGLYEDFSSDKCLINTSGQSIFPTTKTEDNVTYSTINGYALADLEKDYTEWEVNDLRSYHQRPAIRLKKLINTICREENSGYDVEFDESFFNTRNPYWEKTFVALPLLTSNEIEQESDPLTSVEKTVTSSHYSGYYNSSNVITANGRIAIAGTDVTTDGSGNIDFTGATGSTIDLTVDFQLRAFCNSNGENNLYLWYKRTQYANYMQYAGVYLTVVDTDSNQVLGYSSAYQFEHEPYYIGGDPFLISTPEGSAVSEVPGRFVKASTGVYYFTSNGGSNTWRLIINGCPTARHMKVCINTLWYQNSSLQSDPSVYQFTLAPDINSYSGYKFYTETMIDSDHSGGAIVSAGTVTTGMNITKSLLLKTEKTPADFLLDYTKLFGLYFIKDVGSKKITICSRNTFFTGETVDFSDRIDYSKNITVTPILFDKKFYLMQRETPETKVSKRYKDQYAQEYGQQRLATGYNFNYETKKLYDGNLYQSVVPMLNSDKYFRKFYDNENTAVPAFLNDNCTYHLYNGDDTIDIGVYARDWVASSQTVEWNASGKDFWPKLCFFAADGDEESLQEISASLVMYNGLKRMRDSEGHDTVFWITDDVPEMYQLNDGEPCHLYTTHVISAATSTLALPQYINCIYDASNNITASLDFGVPKEIYFGNYAYPEDVTVYANFWKNFYADQFNIDTKKVTCFVKLDNMSQEWLRKFYYFDNAIWILNKVDSYDVNSDATVRCEFIKVKDMNNYTNGQTVY